MNDNLSYICFQKYSIFSKGLQIKFRVDLECLVLHDTLSLIFCKPYGQLACCRSMPPPVIHDQLQGEEGCHSRSLIRQVEAGSMGIRWRGCQADDRIVRNEGQIQARPGGVNGMQHLSHYVNLSSRQSRVNLSKTERVKHNHRGDWDLSPYYYCV